MLIRKVEMILTLRNFNKYHARKITIDGYKFDSRAEAGYYVYLKHSDINFKVHESFEILPCLKIFGKTYRKRVYTPDFAIYENNELKQAIDVKGYKVSADASLRIRSFIAQYKKPVYIVRSKSNGFTKEMF